PPPYSIFTLFPYTTLFRSFMYPRWKYFDEIARLMRQDARIVPVYQDKYFAYAWDDAKRTYDLARQTHIPLLCGSTVPLAWRRPRSEEHTSELQSRFDLVCR